MRHPRSTPSAHLAHSAYTARAASRTLVRYLGGEYTPCTETVGWAGCGAVCRSCAHRSPPRRMFSISDRERDGRDVYRVRFCLSHGRDTAAIPPAVRHRPPPAAARVIRACDICRCSPAASAVRFTLEVSECDRVTADLRGGSARTDTTSDAGHAGSD